MLYRAHIGSTSDLIQIACEQDMEIELQRSKAAEEFKARLIARLSLMGYLTVSDIEDEVGLWHEDQL